ncbi:MAG TPA: hypothetical protein VF081_11935 [Solirubrobacterales bacterium]
MRIFAVLGGLIAVALIVWVALDSSDSKSDKDAGTQGAEAETVSVASLRKAAAAQDTPIYWAGLTAGSELELSRPSADRTYVRYLPAGVEAGDPRPFLTVGSYRFEDPTAALRSRSSEPGGVLASAPGGGVVYFDRTNPKSVYLAYPDTEVEVEVFAPEFKEALQLVTDGRIVPVE